MDDSVVQQFGGSVARSLKSIDRVIAKTKKAVKAKKADMKKYDDSITKAASKIKKMQKAIAKEMIQAKKDEMKKFEADIKKAAQKIEKMKKKLAKLTACAEGKMRNPETGRCRKVKSPKAPCKPGKVRSSITGRCRKVKSSA